MAAGTGRGRLDDGEVWAQPGIRVGYVPQEPPFDAGDDRVSRLWFQAWAKRQALLAEYHECRTDG
jgi:ATP-binding cassette subfamily F protein uup